jgi:hypothetical protein
LVAFGQTSRLKGGLMDSNERPVSPHSRELLLAPIQFSEQPLALSICILVRIAPTETTGPFVLLRALPGAQVYLGALCDAAARVQEWLEIWVQSLDTRDLVFSHHEERLSNVALDQRWIAQYEAYLAGQPEALIITGMEQEPPSPVVIRSPGQLKDDRTLPIRPSGWLVCKDDSLLQSFGLPTYSNSPFRYLYAPAAGNPPTFLATNPDAPASPHVQGLERLDPDGNALAIFNPHAGLIQVTRHCPLELDDYLEILEGQPWVRTESPANGLSCGNIYGELQVWSAQPKGIAFLLHRTGRDSDRVGEVFFLKLAALHGCLKEVQNAVRLHQLPLLNVAPRSFAVSLQRTGDQFPSLWTAACRLIIPGQAYPLKIECTDQKYFIRVGPVEPSPFLPEGLGAHSLGVGTVRIRNVLSEANGTVLEGTLVAGEYLALDPYDLLWFNLPLPGSRLEFYAHVYTSENVGPKEARFRTVPTQLPEATVTTLKRSAGTVFPRSPYEIWPLLSSPCDLYSLAIMGIRMLLTNSKTNLPVVVDDFLSLSRTVGKNLTGEAEVGPALKSLVDHDKSLLDLVSPHLLIEGDLSPAQARESVPLDTWLAAIGLLLRLIPGAGSHSCCKSFGDVSPLALETVFDQPVQELEVLLRRLRGSLLPSLSANQEIASILLEALETV